MDRQTALDLDRADPLAFFPAQFSVSDKEVCYLDGNSLGRLPLQTIEAVNAFLSNEWGAQVVTGWTDWITKSQHVGDLVGSAALGAARGQVLVGDSTSVNFYQLAVAAIKARPGRHKIITDESNFPTDRYILQGIAEQFGLEIILIPNSDSAIAENELITTELLAHYLDEDVALVSFEVVNYRSGARHDVKALTELAHEAGALVLWDAAHAVGSVKLNFDADDVDLAVGCTYKYGNSGPGAPGWLYVSQRLQQELSLPIQGWFAQAKQFEMGDKFTKAEGITGFMLGSPNIIGLVCVQSAFEMIAEAGIEEIEAKAQAGTEFMLELYEHWLKPLGFGVATPLAKQNRGGHISLTHVDAEQIAVAMREQVKVIPDFRAPNVIRVAVSPLANSYVEIYDGFARIRELVSSGGYKQVRLTKGLVR
jgi:kynureninase